MPLAALTRSGGGGGERHGPINVRRHSSRPACSVPPDAARVAERAAACAEGKGGGKGGSGEQDQSVGGAGQGRAAGGLTRGALAPLRRVCFAAVGAFPPCGGAGQGGWKAPRRCRLARPAAAAQGAAGGRRAAQGTPCLLDMAGMMSPCPHGALAQTHASSRLLPRRVRCFTPCPPAPSPLGAGRVAAPDCGTGRGHGPGGPARRRREAALHLANSGARRRQLRRRRSVANAGLHATAQVGGAVTVSAVATQWQTEQRDVFRPGWRRLPAYRSPFLP